MEVEPLLSGEVGCPRGLALLEDGGTHQRSSYHKLAFQYTITQQIIVIVELEKEGSEDSPCSFAYQKLPKIKLQQRIPQFQILPA